MAPPRAIRIIRRHSKHPRPQLLALAEDKRNQRGGFGKRIFLESVE
jgi:hypothetical protein